MIILGLGTASTRMCCMRGLEGIGELVAAVEKSGRWPVK